MGAFSPMSHIAPVCRKYESGSHDILALPVGSTAASAELRCEL